MDRNRLAANMIRASDLSHSPGQMPHRVVTAAVRYAEGQKEHKRMKRISIMLAIVASLMVAGTAMAASTPKLRTFGSADVTQDNGVVTIVAGPVGQEDPTYGGPEYGGVYLSSKSVSGKLASTVDFSFVSSGDVTDAPRISIPIDVDGNGSVEYYAFLGANRCDAVSGVPSTISTTKASCIVDLNNGGSYANWDAFTRANPTARIAPGDSVFIVADGSFDKTYIVEDITLR
jgi:hypothetical protein